jgi:hypothetical protein
VFESGQWSGDQHTPGQGLVGGGAGYVSESLRI